MASFSPNKISFISLLIALVFVLGVNSTYAITGGEEDVNNEYDNVLMIGVSAFDGTQYIPQTICTGILVHERVVLTAGHCIDFIETLKGFVGAENVLVEAFEGYDQQGSEPGGGFPSVDQIKSPYYWWGPTSNPYDIGAVTFDKNYFPNITPAMLPGKGFLDNLKAEGLRPNSKFTVVGYGCTVDWPPPVTNYLDAFVRRYTESSYRALLQAWLRLSTNAKTGDGGSCPGDSGGPIFWTDSNNGDTLVAITSWGDPNNIVTSFNYRVDIPETLDFISEVFESLDGN